MENCPCVDHLPIKMVIFHVAKCRKVLVYRRLIRSNKQRNSSGVDIAQATIKSVNKIAPLSEIEPFDVTVASGRPTGLMAMKQTSGSKKNT